MSTNLTKREIVLEIYRKTGFPQKQIVDTVQQTLDIVQKALANGRNVELRNFGVLEVQVRKQRIGRNPNKPEAEVIIPRFRGDLLQWLWAAASGELPEEPPPFSSDHALAVVMAAQGYPGAPLRGDEIRGLERAAELAGVRVFHAGTRRQGEKTVADGGRVLVMTGLAPDLASARERAYAAVEAVEWKSGFFRTDIGYRALQRSS